MLKRPLKPDYAKLQRRARRQALWLGGLFALLTLPFLYSDENYWYLLAPLIGLLFAWDYKDKTMAAYRGELKEELQLVAGGIRYIWEGNHSTLHYDQVVAVEVKGSLWEPEALLYRMQDGSLHEISHYEHLGEILRHSQATIPLGRFHINNR